jgi:hypothetical protein
MGLPQRIEEKYKVKYIGYYDIPSHERVYLFYQSNPRTDLGHTNYLAVYWNPMTEGVYLTDGSSVLGAKYPAISFADGKILCSRYRHDYKEYNGAMIDGGLDYTRYNPKYPPNGYVHIVDDHEEFVYYEGANVRECEVLRISKAA